MSKSRYPHIFLNDLHETKPFTTTQRGREPDAPSADRSRHSAKLKDEWIAIWAKAKEKDQGRTAVSKPVKDGVYIEFEGVPGFPVLTKRLESPTNGVRLLNVYEIVSSQDPDKKITRATVFIPNGKQHLFLKKITDYADEEKDTRKGNPKNEPLMQSISNMHLAVLESFWRDDLDLLPMVNEPVWCEIWLSSTDEDVERDFRDLAESLEIEVNDRTLRFPERCVLLALANNAQLTELLQASSYIAEFRRAKESPRFFLDIENREQAEWAESLSSRLNIPNDSNVSVCILDTGVNNGHLLLKPLLSDEDCHTVDPNWGVADRVGHGTWMSGLATYGDLTEALQGNQAVTIRHRLESVKILDSGATNDPELYGNLTIQGISRAEITAKDRKRINCLAITSEDGRDNGKANILVSCD
jgi:hypothetical protein